VEVVRTADDDGAGQAVDHLVSLGHRDIVHIDGDSHLARLEGQNAPGREIVIALRLVIRETTAAR
jgi:DNA-binding LacI/PurR family transcriptional regulator